MKAAAAIAGAALELISISAFLVSSGWGNYARFFEIYIANVYRGFGCFSVSGGLGKFFGKTGAASLYWWPLRDFQLEVIDGYGYGWPDR